MQIKRQQKKLRVRLIIGGTLVVLSVCSWVFFFPRPRSDQSTEAKPASIQTPYSKKLDNGFGVELKNTALVKEQSRAPNFSRETKVGDIIRPSIAQIRAYEQKLSAIRLLSHRLSSDEVDAVFGLLNTPYRPELGVSVMQWDSLKNEAFNQLLKQETVPGNVYARLSSVWSNRKLSEPSREYAVQFYVLFLEQSILGNTFNNNDLDIFSSALMHSKLQGTALIGLGHLVGDFPELLEFVELNEIANGVISGNSSPKARSAAIQTLIRTGDQRELAQIRDIAINASDTVERLSAIAALGELGGSDEIETIIRIENSETPLFANAAQVARGKIYSRIETNQAF